MTKRGQFFTAYNLRNIGEINHGQIWHKSIDWN